jgi:cobalt transporter subunit CbtA
MLIRVLIAAILAGILAGCFYTAVQAYRVIPLILEAERYEADMAFAVHDHGTEEADGAETDWAPEDGWERLFFTLISNIGIGVAFSLLVTAAILVSNQRISLRSGLVWGLCGFAVFVLAPNFGLPPELPGMQAAGLAGRQVWWFATVGLTATGMALFAFKGGILYGLAGVILILAPHVYGAPQPVSHESAVPANLAAEFVMATVVSSALFWLFLGSVLGLMLGKAFDREGQLQS